MGKVISNKIHKSSNTSSKMMMPKNMKMEMNMLTEKGLKGLAAKKAKKY